MHRGGERHVTGVRDLKLREKDTPRSGALGIVAALLAGFALVSSSCGSPTKLKWGDREPSWSHDARRVVFVSNRANPAEDTYAVYVMNADGSGVRRVTYDAGNDESPGFSPDGGRIDYLGHTEDVAAVELDLVGSDGCCERRLAADPGGSFMIPPAWSPDGGLIAFVKTTDISDPDAREDLWVVPANGGRPWRVAKGVDSFAWSHNGRRIAFGCFAGDLCLVGARGGAIHRLTKRGATAFEGGTASVDWSSDDQQIAFVRGSGGSLQPDYNAWVINANGTGKHRLPRFGEGTVDDVRWLPKHPATLLVQPDSGGFYLLRLNGLHKRDVRAEGYDATPSPYGNKLLFVLAVDGGPQPAIYLTTTGGAPVRRLTQARH
jgi:Tol biopolymer transport system component